MRSLLSTLGFFVLFAGLGFAAYLAVPGNAEVVAGAAPAAELAQSAAAAPAATEVYNAIALPLDVQATWASQNIDFNAAGLAAYVGSSVSQVLQLNSTLTPAQFDTWFVADGFGIVNGVFTTNPNAFPLEVGGAYWILVNSSAANVFSIVGDVPAEGMVDYTLVGNSPSCTYNQIMVPLDQYNQNITNATSLATAVSAGNIEQVLRLNSQLDPAQFDTWFVDDGFGIVNGAFTTNPNDFAVQIGHPYWVCVKAGGNGVTWPQ